MTDRPREFVVQRSKWLRGREEGAVLLDGHGCMCCLGFVAAQCGVDSEALIDTSVPCCIAWSPDADGDMRKLDGLLAHVAEQDECGDDIWGDTQLTNDAVVLNDDPELTDADREERLTKLFAAHGYTLRFEP